MKLAAVLAGKSPQVFTIAPEAQVRDAVAIMAANNIGAVIVLGSGGAVSGILSERDVLRDLHGNAAVLDQPIAQLMSSRVVVGSLDDDVEAVLRRMTSGHFRHLPVVEGSTLVGVVTTGDLVMAQLHDLQGAVETLETRLMEEPEEQEHELDRQPS